MTDALVCDRCRKVQLKKALDRNVSFVKTLSRYYDLCSACAFALELWLSNSGGENK